MCAELTVSQTGDDILEIATPSSATARLLADEIGALGLCEDIVPGMICLSLRVHPANFTALESALARLVYPANEVVASAAIVTVPIHYGGPYGPDLKHICRTLNLSESRFVDLHSSATYTVDLIGFTPGFTYLGGLDARLSVPRLATPRPRLEAGSVGISGANTGLYALSGPGGWPIVGRTEIPLFDARAEPPFILQPGVHVRFEAV